MIDTVNYYITTTTVSSRWHENSRWLLQLTPDAVSDSSVLHPSRKHAFLGTRRSYKEVAGHMSFQCSQMNPPPDRQPKVKLDIWEKLCAITDCEH